MKLFKKSTMSLALTAAVAAGTMTGVSLPAHAVEIAHDGLGEVLVFPFYTTREGFSTQFNITNTSDKTVAVKVRWREALNSRDVLDFNVILSPYDVWVANVANNGEGAIMETTDTSCTVPNLASVNYTVPFSAAAYTRVTNGTNVQDSSDTGPTGLDRTREGYFEVISMGELISEASTIGIWAKHGSGQNNTARPRNCAAINTAWANDLGSVALQFNAPENSLKGRAQLTNAATSMGIGFDPLVLKNFRDSSEIIASSGGNVPSLNDADAFLGQGYEAVEALILRDGVINDYNIQNGSQTDWVMTFPTKNFHVDIPYARNSTSNFPANDNDYPIAPFVERFGGSADGKSCFPVSINMWDREEFEIAIDDSNENVFSPAEPTPGVAGSSLCYEANVLTFGGEAGQADDPVGIFGSKVGKVIDDSLLPSSNNGWAKVSFGGVSLPVIGMRLESRTSPLDDALKFGFSHDHAYTTPVITETPL